MWLLLLVWRCTPLILFISFGLGFENEKGGLGNAKDDNERGYAQFLDVVVGGGFIHNEAGIKFRERNKKPLDLTPSEKFDIDARCNKTTCRSQKGEDRVLYNRYFRGVRDGVFIESGAFDGYNLSTSLLFDRLLGWKSIHIEADPVNFQRLIQNRPDSVNVHMALCDKPQILHYVDTGIDVAHGIVEFMADTFLKAHHGRLYRDKSLIKTLREVPCFPVRYLLRYLQVRKVDCWVLDTEGSEEAVLNGWNPKSSQVKVFGIECDVHNYAKNERIMKKLQVMGYECTNMDQTCYCRLKPRQE